jgi:catechol 2,3-dioxygenase-like lactoylglutathione lyase family enzyme
MPARLAALTYLVRDYDEALAWFTRCLGFRVIEDTLLVPATPATPAKRWVLIAAPGDLPTALGTHLLLARASTPAQVAALGHAAGGRVAFFLHTDDFARDHAAFRAAGVIFREAPRHEPYGTVAVFEDLYGQAWDLVQLAQLHPPARLNLPAKI